MTNPTPEQLMQWKEAGVLFAVATEDGTVGPLFLDAALTVKSRNPAYQIGGYRAPGHIQPHDGSAERPEHVKVNDLVIVSRRTQQSDWWSDVEVGLDDWSDVHFYIALPEIKP